MTHESSASVVAEYVHMVWDYHDCPRSGIADFLGKPHVFQCQFDEADDDWTDLYWLMEVDQQVVALADEQEVIFRRWYVAFSQGRATIDGHSALPADRARCDALTAAIGHRLALQPEWSVIRRGRFSTRATSDGVTVQWDEPE